MCSQLRSSMLDELLVALLPGNRLAVDEPGDRTTNHLKADVRARHAARRRQIAHVSVIIT